MPNREDFWNSKTAQVGSKLVEEVVERTEVLRGNEVELVDKENKMTKTELKLVQKIKVTK